MVFAGTPLTLLDAALRGSVLAPISMGLQRAMPLLFAVLAAVAAAAHWRSDLMEARRRLRAFILVTSVAYSVVMVAARLGSPQGRLSAGMAMIDVLALDVIAAGVAWQLLRLAGTELFAATPAARPAALAEPPPPDPAEDRLAQTLQRLMAGERAYRTEDLTIASLAARLAVPEYRLLGLINQPRISCLRRAAAPCSLALRCC